MEIRIQAIRFDTSQQLEDFIQKKVAKLDKFHDGILSAEVVLKVVKPESANNKNASLKVSASGQDFFAEKLSDSFEESIVDAIEAVEKQITKFKEKQKSK
ncbi:MAG: ribosome-associated translation inhibitor RaiA [Dysgonamonadaceae bacterium]|jgi:putative sigma-54 modulation protein|nr:ribosome-associated translation inhibitor RaiA [Dysgonamonadaceae bacterium]